MTAVSKSTRASDGKYTVDAVAAMVILREYLAHPARPRSRFSREGDFSLSFS